MMRAVIAELGGGDGRHGVRRYLRAYHARGQRHPGDLRRPQLLRRVPERAGVVERADLVKMDLLNRAAVHLGLGFGQLLAGHFDGRPPERPGGDDDGFSHGACR